MAVKPRAERGRRVELHEKFVELLKEKVETDKRLWESIIHKHPFLAALGMKLAKAVNRPEPWSKSAVQRFLVEAKFTAPMTLAFCAVYELPDPLITAASPDDARWFWIGRDLQDLSPAVFDREVTSLGAVAAEQRKNRGLPRRTGTMQEPKIPLNGK